MRYLFIFALLILVSSISRAQDLNLKNNVFVEVGGNGLLAAINYERMVLQNPQLRVRAGVGFYSIKEPYYFTIPIGINYLYGLKNKKTFVDIGMGVTYCKADVQLFMTVDYNDPNFVNTNYFNFIPSLGIRRHTSYNLMWRVGFTPVINHLGFIPFVGLSVGKMF